MKRTRPLRFIPFGEVVEKNGKTIRENNLARHQHHIPVGTLVEVTIHKQHRSTWLRGSARMFVLYHARAADGMPYYTLAMADPFDPCFKRRPTDVWAEIVAEREAPYLPGGQRDDSHAGRQQAADLCDRMSFFRWWWGIEENYPPESLRVVMADEGTLIDGEGI